MATHADKKLRAAYIQWIANQPQDFDIAISWHLPNSYRIDDKAWSKTALSNHLRWYFKRLDKAVKRSTGNWVQMPRVVALEHAPGVGWHGHGLIASATTGMPQEELIALLECCWFESLSKYPAGKFESRLVLAAPNNGSYHGYITKSLSATDFPLAGEIDVFNSELQPVPDALVAAAAA